MNIEKAGKVSIGFNIRKELWYSETGLKYSKAMNETAVSFLDKYSDPEGFDHTQVYYSPEHKLHVLVTEPYDSADDALISVKRIAALCGTEFSFALGAKGNGLWYPGCCFTLLLARAGTEKILERYAQALPTRMFKGERD